MKKSVLWRKRGFLLVELLPPKAGKGRLVELLPPKAGKGR
jgi:hypothetical protein